MASASTNVPSAEIASDFHFSAVPFKGNPIGPTKGNLLASGAVSAPTQVPLANPTTASDDAAVASLGLLSNFTGTFSGPGFNTIFRPNNKGPNNTNNFPIPLNPAPPAGLNDNVLELNLTQDTLSFSAPLGSVPNRGFQNQEDIFLNGVPYVQTVNDVTNTNTGKRDAKPTGIHFEPGLWMNVPATTVNPVLANTLCRMASIPHGTTIKAEGISPIQVINGPPTIPSVSITPFPIGTPNNPIVFPNQTVSNNTTSRLPQDLSKFVAAGTITQDILNDPNTVLRNAIKGQNITKTIVFTVSTNPAVAGEAAGTANIDFLQGGSQGNNALAAEMTATFWIETVSKPKDVEVGIFPHLHTNVSITQIQYSQTVLLNFNGLSWPHVSVATLVPVHSGNPVNAPWGGH